MSNSPIPTVTGRSLAAAIAVTALVSGTVYGFTVTPTVTGEDSGELIAAAYTLGIPHPPGYPLWCLTAHAAIKLIPFGEIAWRANLVSALFGVLAACTVTAIVMRLTASFIAGVTGGLTFAFAHEVWEQSTVAEVYTQFAFLFALTLYFVIRWRDTGQPRMLYGAAFAAGLGVVAHGLMLLPLPVFAIGVLWPRNGESAKFKQIGVGAVAFLAPFLLLLYLPIRSAADPAMDWGNPETFGAFWDVLMRAQYEGLLTDNPRSLDLLFKQLQHFVDEFNMQALLVLGPIGLFFGFFLRRYVGFLLLALFLATALGSILLTNFPIEEPDLWLNYAYWLPVYVLGATGTGLMVGVLQIRTAHRRTLRLMPFGVAAAAILMSVGTLFGLWNAADQRGNRFVYEYAENALSTIPENAIYIGGGDHTLFPLIYLQIVEGRRLDVTIANPYGYIDMERVDGLREAFPAEAKKTIPSEESEPAMVEWIAKNSGRPVYSANPLRLSGFRSEPHGLLYRIAAPGDVLDDPYAIWHAYTNNEVPIVNDWTSRLIQFDYFAAAAERYFSDGNRSKGEIYLLAAATYAIWNNHYGGGNKHSFNNLAIIAARGNIPELAEEFWLRSLEIDPEFELARRNLAKFRERQESKKRRGAEK